MEDTQNPNQTQEQDKGPESGQQDAQQDADRYEGFESVNEDTVETLKVRNESDENEAYEEIEAAQKETKQDEKQDSDGKKKRYQKRIDTLVSERTDAQLKAEKLEKELAALKEEKLKQPEKLLSEDEFDTYDEYLDYVQEYNARQIKPINPEDDAAHRPDSKDKDADKAQDKKSDEPELVLTDEQAKAHARLAERFRDIDDKPADFYDVLEQKELRITPAMLEILASCDIADKVAYHLGKNLDVAKDIASRPIFEQAREIAMLEVELKNGSKPPRQAQKKTTQAPEPISPVGQSDATSKPLSQLAYGDYEAVRQRQIQSQSNGGW